MTGQYCPECNCYLPVALARKRIEPWISARENGASMREIGESLGVTSERARQLFKQAGRADLCRIDKPRKTKSCKGCGKTMLATKTPRFCSDQCRRSAKRKAALETLLPFAEARRAGKSWTVIGRELGGSKSANPAAQAQRVRRLAARHGIDFEAMVTEGSDGEEKVA